MARRRNKRKESPIEIIFILFATIVAYFLYFVIRLVLLIYDAITIYTSEYKIKSGNGFFKTYFNKGNYGEFKLYKVVTKVFGKNNVFTNVYLDNENTDQTEVDVIAVTNHGVYVFEMKNYSGYVYGSEYDKTWTQVLNRFSKYKFYNPLRQNYAHTKAVENYLEIDEAHTVPVIVFSNKSKLSKINVSEEKVIIQLKDVKKYLKNNVVLDEEIFTLEQTNVFATKLIERSNMPQEVKDEHIRQVVALQEMREEA